MLLSLILAAAALPAAAPATVMPQSMAQAEKQATTRCMMRRLHLPAGRGIGGHEANCTHVARAEVAALAKQQTVLAARETPSDIGRD